MRREEIAVDDPLVVDRRVGDLVLQARTFQLRVARRQPAVDPHHVAEIAAQHRRSRQQLRPLSGVVIIARLVGDEEERFVVPSYPAGPKIFFGKTIGPPTIKPN